MTILPHLLLTTVGVQALGLEGRDIALAYGFGYGIDLVDHPIKLALYLRKNGRKNEKNYHWRTPLQEPVALCWIVPLSLYLGTAVPVLFFASHFLLDYLVGYIHWGIITLAISQIADGVDGGVARRYNLESKQGRLLEVVYDRLNELAILLALAFAGYATLMLAGLAFLTILLSTAVEPYSHF